MSNKFLILIFMPSLLSCTSNSITNNDYYDSTKYKLQKIDYDLSGRKKIIASKIFFYQDDTTRKMFIYYWDNGNILAKGFLKNGLRDGVIQYYSDSGKLLSSENYKKGKKILIK